MQRPVSRPAVTKGSRKPPVGPDCRAAHPGDPAEPAERPSSPVRHFSGPRRTRTGPRASHRPSSAVSSRSAGCTAQQTSSRRRPVPHPSRHQPCDLLLDASLRPSHLLPLTAVLTHTDYAASAKNLPGAAVERRRPMAVALVCRRIERSEAGTGDPRRPSARREGDRAREK